LKTKIYLNIVDDLDEVSMQAIKAFSRAHQISNNRFYIVPGGSTPKLFYNKLANTISDWENTKFIMSDERVVPGKDDNSNEAMFKNRLLNKINSENKIDFISLLSDKVALEKKLSLLTPQLTILGMGADGHTASLFPKNPIIFNNENFITIQLKNKWENFERITLSFEYLMKSKRIILLVVGEEKAKTLQYCLEGSYNPQDLPLQYILNNFKNEIHVICDKGAGKFLA